MQFSFVYLDPNVQLLSIYQIRPAVNALSDELPIAVIVLVELYGKDRLRK